MSKKDAFKLPLFVADDRVDEDFARYIVNETELQKLIREKRYTVKDTDVSYRVISHWDEKGVLPSNFNESENGWRKFSFVEIVWLHSVKKLRSFGLPLESIAEIKKKVMWLNEEEQSYPWFEYYVMKSKHSSMDGYIVVAPDGNADLAFSRQIESIKLFFGSRSLTIISLKDVLQSMGLKVAKPETLFSLSNTETDVVDVLRNSNVDEVKLKLKGGKVVSIDTSKTISGSDIKSIKDEILKSEDFAEVIAKFEAGKEQSAKVIKKRRV